LRNSKELKITTKIECISTGLALTYKLKLMKIVKKQGLKKLKLMLKMKVDTFYMQMKSDFKF
jgi:hypothetical protein